MDRDLLLEIGTEEIPAGFLPLALNDIAQILSRELKARKIGHGEIKTYATPRRLVVAVNNLAERAADQLQEKLGPPAKSAWDEQGKPTAAAIGFARSQGVDISSLETVATQRGDYLCVRKKIIGAATAPILPTLLTGFISSLPFRKSMRWGTLDFRFARPIRWILALYGNAPISFQLGNIISGETSRGHRFLNPVSFKVTGLADYLKKTREHAVLVDPSERKEIISAEAQKAAQAVGGLVHMDLELLTTVAFLVEYPQVVLGRFDHQYLALPKELLMTTMMTHQKYFPVIDSSGKLLPYFITVSNTKARDMDVVRRGNEKVIRARLADARFFFEEDQKIRLRDRMESLSQVMFHSLLGTACDKARRFTAIAVQLAKELMPDAVAIVERAAGLAKADLTTQMVGEFPELQGIMGREYALIEGEDPEVAQAIYEHYLPILSGGNLPQSDAGAIISIADKIDSIVGFFGVNLPPSGTADPYALRRQALGIINIIMDRGYKIELESLINLTLLQLTDYLKRPKPDIQREVLDFFQGRFTNLLISQGYPFDLVEAVLAGRGVSRLLDTKDRISALETFRTHAQFEELVTAFKRVENIIKGQPGGAVINWELLIEEEEKRLFDAFIKTKESVCLKSAAGDYLGSFRELFALKKPIDDFFAKVMVMAKEEDIRQNRIALLQEISTLVRSLADFSKF